VAWSMSKESDETRLILDNLGVLGEGTLGQVAAWVSDGAGGVNLGDLTVVENEYDENALLGPQPFDNSDTPGLYRISFYALCSTPDTGTVRFRFSWADRAGVVRTSTATLDC